MKRDCFTCYYTNWISDRVAECGYPMPTCVPKYKIQTGVWGKLPSGNYGADYNKVGYLIPRDKSLIEITDCPCYKRKSN